jgi:benzoyl-CoA reductase/2-hydroxyglutaryl-CoA dehydratase subunit BcrC/BadD/HgdB
MNNIIGITTTVPTEILLAAGYQPVDLNNVLINDPNPERLVSIAERDGFPLNTCSWIKGIYAVCLDRSINNVLCVTTGDCSNTKMLAEVLRLKGLQITTFAFPEKPNIKEMKSALEALAKALGTSPASAETVRGELQPGRNLARELDHLTWAEGQVSGFENHLWLVSSSDFNQDYPEYCRKLAELLADCRGRPPYRPDWLRLAYIGVPSVYAGDLYRYLESQHARVVFNEIQRQFTMPCPGDSLAEQYSNYTYPYSIKERLTDIIPTLAQRRIDGVIHYTQAFCHRGIGDIIFRSALKIPILTLEGNDNSRHVLRLSLMCSSAAAAVIPDCTPAQHRNVGNL